MLVAASVHSFLHSCTVVRINPAPALVACCFYMRRFIYISSWIDSASSTFACCSWTRPDGGEHLFLRPDATFAPGKPITSGVQLGFPQWREGVLPEDGFSSRCTWEVVHTDLSGRMIPVQPPGLETGRLGSGLSPEDHEVLANWQESVKQEKLEFIQLPDGGAVGHSSK